MVVLRFWALPQSPSQEFRISGVTSAGFSSSKHWFSSCWVCRTCSAEPVQTVIFSYCCLELIYTVIVYQRTADNLRQNLTLAVMFTLVLCIEVIATFIFSPIARGTSSDGVDKLELNCYLWGIQIEVEIPVVLNSAFITSLSYRCTNSAGILVCCYCYY